MMPADDETVVQARNSYYVGMVYAADFYEQRQGMPPRKYHYKHRLFVVIACFQYHCVALPIYTHRGTGLEKKKHKDEYVSIRDESAPNPAPAESKWPNLTMSTNEQLRGKAVNPLLRGMSDKAAVRITYPTSQDYACPCILVGRLENGSLGRLLQVFASSMAPRAEVKFVMPITVSRDAPAGFEEQKRKGTRRGPDGIPYNDVPPPPV